MAKSNRGENILGFIKRVLASNKFFWFTLVLFFLQAAWVALSYIYPMVYDEKFHFEAIQYFSEGHLPIVFSQNAMYDNFGSLAFGSVSLFHFIFGGALGILRVFTSDFEIQVLTLRFLNILLALTGILLYKRLFNRLGINKAFSNLALLVYALIPMTTLVAATINYDNFMLPLTALFLMLGVEVIKQREMKFWGMFNLILVGMVASLVKFSFLPIFFFGLLFILVYKRRLINSKLTNSLRKQAMYADRKIAIAATAVFVLFSLMFTYRFIYATVRYGSPFPDCQKVLSLDRCQSSPVYKLEHFYKQTKNERKPQLLGIYTQDWTKLMIFGFSHTANNTVGGNIDGDASPKIINNFVFVFVVLSLFTTIYYWRSTKNDSSRNFIVFTSVAFVASTLLFNALSYYSANYRLTENSRYLLPVVPVFIVYGLINISRLLGRHSGMKIVALAASLLIALQGAGVLTHIVRSNDSMYWQKEIVIETNGNLRDVVEVFVKEEWPL